MKFQMILDQEKEEAVFARVHKRTALVDEIEKLVLEGGQGRSGNFVYRVGVSVACGHDAEAGNGRGYLKCGIFSCNGIYCRGDFGHLSVGAAAKSNGGTDSDGSALRGLPGNLPFKRMAAA